MGLRVRIGVVGGWVKGLAVEVSGLGFRVRVWGVGCRGWGVGCDV